jgi:hypothetical protein
LRHEAHVSCLPAIAFTNLQQKEQKTSATTLQNISIRPQDISCTGRTLTKIQAIKPAEKYLEDNMLQPITHPMAANNRTPEY